MKSGKRNITLIASVVTVVLIATVVGIRIRQRNIKSSKYFVTEHTNYLGEDCKGKIISTCQTPFNQCYNMKILQPERNFELDKDIGGIDFSKDAFDRYDKVIEYDKKDGRPLQIQLIYYFTNDLSCSGNQDTSIGGTTGAGYSCDSFTADNYSESYFQQLLKK